MIYTSSLQLFNGHDLGGWVNVITRHPMAKAAVSVYEAAVEAGGESE